MAEARTVYTGDRTRVEAPRHIDAVRQRFDSLAEGYETRYPGVTDHLGVFVDLLPPGGRVLDVGCGTGTDAAFLAERGLNVATVDLSPAMVQRARSLHPGLAFDVGEMHDLPYPPGRFDGVLAAFSIIFLPDGSVVPVLRRFRELLVEDGVLFVVVQEGEQDMVGVPLIFSHRGLLERLRAAGFRPVRDFVRNPRAHEQPTRKRFVMARSGPATETRDTPQTA